MISPIEICKRGKEMGNAIFLEVKKILPKRDETMNLVNI